MKPKKPHAKRINKNDQLLESLFLSEGNIAFLDAEFNSGMHYATGERVNEIISVGLVIVNEAYEEVARYYSLVRQVSPVPVFSLITRMTGITTAMLKDAPDFLEVSDQITELIDRWQVEKIFTWGAADGHSLSDERQLLRQRKKVGYAQSLSWSYIDKCIDISGAISAQLLCIRGGLFINVENLMFFCEIEREHEHNALGDALDLYECMQYLRKHYPVEGKDYLFIKKRKLVNQYYQERSMYNSFRRFRSSSKGSDLYGTWDMISAEEDIRMKALEDDLAFLKGEIPYEQEFDTIQDYFDTRAGKAY